MSVPNFTVTCLIVPEIFLSGPKWWSDRLTDIAIHKAMPLAWLKSDNCLVISSVTVIRSFQTCIKVFCTMAHLTDSFNTTVLYKIRLFMDRNVGDSPITPIIGGDDIYAVPLLQEFKKKKKMLAETLKH